MSQNRSKSSKMAKKGPGGSKFHNFRKKIEKMESNTALKNAIFSFSRGTPGEIFKIGPKIDFGGHFLLENHYFLPILAKSTKNRPQRGQKGGPMAPLQRVVQRPLSRAFAVVGPQIWGPLRSIFPYNKEENGKKSSKSVEKYHVLGVKICAKYEQKSLSITYFSVRLLKTPRGSVKRGFVTGLIGARFGGHF